MYIPDYTCSVCTMLPVCVFSGLPFRAAQPVAVLFPVEDHLSHSQCSLVVCNSLCRIEVLWSFPHPLCHVYDCCLCLAPV